MFPYPGQFSSPILPDCQSNWCPSYLLCPLLCLWWLPSDGWEFLMLQLIKWRSNQPFQDSQQPMSGWANGCFRCLLCVSSPFLQRTSTKYAISHWILIFTLGSLMVCLCAAFLPVILFCIYVSFSFQGGGGGGREKGERPTRGKNVDASVKTSLLSLCYCKLF